ncbi:putative zinc-binding protein [bacterium]|nr:putative zinc-binding protein [bacterium]
MLRQKKRGYICVPDKKLIFACSGGSDTGEIADRVARKLDKEGFGKMFCLAGIGGWINWIINKTDSASEILVIDGCMLHCAKKTLENSGFHKFMHICLADLGLKKGSSPAYEELIDMVVSKIKGTSVHEIVQEKVSKAL